MNNRIIELFSKHRFAQEATPENNVKDLYRLITKYLTTDCIMAEIGCFAGVSSELFAIHVKHIHCIDLFAPYGEISDQAIYDAESVFDQLLIKYNNISKLKMSSEKANATFNDSSLDFVYIDGAHDYNNAFKDIQIWLPKIKPNKYIGGHDFNNKDVHKAIIDSKLNIIETFQEHSWIAKIS